MMLIGIILGILIINFILGVIGHIIFDYLYNKDFKQDGYYIDITISLLILLSLLGCIVFFIFSIELLISYIKKINFKINLEIRVFTIKFKKNEKNII